jgi:CBS domain containing-hemolysin-like protein
LLTIFLVVAVSGLLISMICSLTEAAFFAVPLGYVRHRADLGSKSAKILVEYKENMDSAIATILILNTLSNTAGATIVGALASKMWGEGMLIWVSVVYTVLVLVVSEMLPKQAGVLWSRQVALAAAWPVWILIKVFKPIVIVMNFISGLVKKGVEEPPMVTKSEVQSMADIGAEEGVLDKSSALMIRNILDLEKRSVKDILTPRVVVFRIGDDMTIEELKGEVDAWVYSRIPVYSSANEYHLLGFIVQRDLLRAMVKQEYSRKVSEFVREWTTVPEVLNLESLLKNFFSRREHICSVVNEHGLFVGIVTLEDVLEEAMGSEIVDEYDKVSDLQAYARILHTEKKREGGS